MKTTESTPSFLTPYRWLGVASILLAVGIVTIYTPADLYARNSAEFTFPLTVLLAKAAWGAAGLAAALCLPLLIPARRVVRGWACGWFTLAVCVWVSVNFLVLDAGVLDGKSTTLTVSQGFAFGSLAVLAIVAMFALWLAARYPRNTAIAACALNAALAMITATAVTRQAKTVAGQEPPATNNDHYYRYSKTANAMVILLDEFQSDLFREIIDADARLKAAFDGFTYYPDTAGASPRTLTSLPVIHSGRDIDPGRSLQEIYQESVRKGSFLAAHARSGWDAVLLNMWGRSCPEQTSCIATDVLMKGREQESRGEYGRLLDLAVLRAAPAPLKPYVFNKGAWRFQPMLRDAQGASRVFRELQFLRELPKRLTVEDGPPAIKMIHLMITHGPIELDRDCLPREKPEAPYRSGMVEQSRCGVDAIAGLFEGLKQRGIYDSMTIAVIADHGAGWESTHFPGESVAPAGWRAHVGSANPLLLFKPSGKRGQIEVSDRMARIGDIGAMLCADSGACQQNDGVDLQRIDPGVRARNYIRHRWENAFWHYDTMPNVQQFSITGPIFDQRSWKRSAVPELRIGEALLFVPDTQSERYLTWGWWSTEAWGVWSHGKEAVVSFRPRPATRRKLHLVVRARGAVRPEQGRASVRVEANGIGVGQWEFEATKPRGVYDIEIPAKAVLSGDDAVDLRFVMEGGGVQERGPTGRTLGLGLESIQVEEE